MKQILSLVLCFGASSLMATSESSFIERIKNYLNKHEDAHHELAQSQKQLKSLKGKPRESIAPAIANKKVIKQTKAAHKKAIETFKGLKNKGTDGLQRAYKSLNKKIESLHKESEKITEKIKTLEDKARKQSNMAPLCVVRELEAEQKGINDAIRILQDARGNVKRAEDSIK